MDQKTDIEIPRYFLCPISLQIMQDPVTAVTGITYDRAAIEKWISTSVQPVCPVTKQPLQNSDLTPNHTLRRLIQSWCVANAKHGVERIPTPKSPISKCHVSKILRNLTVPHLQPTALDRLLAIIASASTQDKQLLVDPTLGLVKALTKLIINCYQNNQVTTGLKQGMKILTGILTLSSDFIIEDYEFINAITWILTKNDENTQNLGVVLTKEVVKVASCSLLERLKPEFYQALVKIIHQRGNNNYKSVKGVIRILLEISQYGRNRHRINEVGVIYELIELELELGFSPNSERKKITELNMSLLAQLCSCADGRAQFLAHAGGVAVVSKKILRVSSMVDDRAIQIMSLICKYSGTKEVLQEMLRVGAVSKVCMVLQADCAKYLKDQVREILRMHSHAWSNSPCIQLYLFTRYPILQF